MISTRIFYMGSRSSLPPKLLHVPNYKKATWPFGWSVTKMEIVPPSISLLPSYVWGIYTLFLHVVVGTDVAILCGVHASYKLQRLQVLNWKICRTYTYCTSCSCITCGVEH